MKSFRLKSKQEKLLVKAVENFVEASDAWANASHPFSTDAYGNVNFRRSPELAARDNAFQVLRQVLAVVKQ